MALGGNGNDRLGYVGILIDGATVILG